MSLEEKYLKTQLKKENCIDTGIFDNFRFPKNEFSVTFKRVGVFSKLIVALLKSDRDKYIPCFG